MRAHRIWFPDNVGWINEAEDEIFNWTGLPSEPDDIIDTLSDAVNDLAPTTEVLAEEDATELQTLTRPLVPNLNVAVPGLRAGSSLANITTRLGTQAKPRFY